MKRLYRTFPLTILNGFSHKRDNWNDAPKDDIWIALEQLQDDFCAYCECKLKRKHIEHFRTRTNFPHLTFDWNNLFGSCGDSTQTGGWDRCGIYKDHPKGAGPYNIENIIKPDIENPSDYLLFLTSGHVVPRKQKDLKATETIRVFNLNDDTRLFNSRKRAVEAILENVQALYEMQEELKDDWVSFLNDELANLNGKEFQTALEDAWRDNRQY